jgi:hypothetical protein
MPRQYAGHYSDPKDTEGQVRTAVQSLAADNINLWATYVLDTVSDFESDAVLHIDQLEYDHTMRHTASILFFRPSRHAS